MKDTKARYQIQDLRETFLACDDDLHSRLKNVEDSIVAFQKMIDKIHLSIDRLDEKFYKIKDVL